MRGGGGGAAPSSGPRPATPAPPATPMAERKAPLATGLVAETACEQQRFRRKGEKRRKLKTNEKRRKGDFVTRSAPPEAPRASTWTQTLPRGRFAQRTSEAAWLVQIA